MTKAELLSKVIGSDLLTEHKATIAVDAVWEAIDKGLNKSDIVSLSHPDGKRVIYARRTKYSWRNKIMHRAKCVNYIALG